MFDSTSRYASVETATLLRRELDSSSRPTAYKRRRFVPPLGDAITLLEHRYLQGERLDNITARYLGDPTQFWRVCDDNEVLRPAELTEQVGHPITIAMPRL